MDKEEREKKLEELGEYGAKKTQTHNERHSEFVEDCFACKIRSVVVDSSVYPTRKKRK